MRPIRYSINVTLDGCVDHEAAVADESLHRHAAANLARADALLFGRITYRMMEDAWRPDPVTGTLPEWMEPRMEPFARTIDAAPKFVVSSTLGSVDWNAQLITGGPVGAVRKLKAQPGDGIAVGGVTLPLALAEAGLIDEYEFIVHPRVVGRGPALLAGLTTPLDLRPVGRTELDSGAVAMRYRPRS